MPAEPDIKRADSFIDGQNLYRHAMDAFGHHHPNFDPRRLAGRRRYVNVPKGNGEQPARRRCRLWRQADTGGNIPEKPRAGVHLAGLVDDPTELPGGGDAADLREQRIDLFGDPGAGLGIDARAEGADVHTIPSVA